MFNLIDIFNLKKKYFENFFVLNNLNLSVLNGEFLAILGRNGAGKSTFINILVSLVKKTSGKIYINSFDFDYFNLSIRNMIGIVPQEINLNHFDIVYNSIFNSAGFYGLSSLYIKDRVDILLKLFELWDFRYSVISSLSGGMKKRLMLIKALIHDPDILILDEPTAGVDVFSRRLILDFLKNLNSYGKTILLTTHYFEEVEYLCNRFIIIDKSNIVKDALVCDFLLKKTFVFIVDKIDSLIYLKNFNIKIIDNNSFEIFLNKDQNISCFLNEILKLEIIIKSMYEKKFLIEDYFINSLIK